ncbi:hypothetical protein [Treponema pectinovorum]|uniref:hypothetical protein n=1 Tax=Treponema pectinovorum TaxID=164 RepID=UPI0011CC920D|nr:hypothetical protein [Treponema pectinovorum]
MGNKNQSQKSDDKKDEKTQAPAAENQQIEKPSQRSTEQTATPQTDDGSTAPAVPELLSTDEKGDNKTGDTDKTSTDKNTAAKTVKMVLKHKSHTTNYHRCGLTLTTVFAEYEVPAECVDKIKADRWICVQDEK